MSEQKTRTTHLPNKLMALLPIIFLPMLGLCNVKASTAPYAHPTIYLFFGGFLLGLAMDNGFVLPPLPAWLAAALPGLLAIVSAGGFALSYCISQAVYAKKEF